MACFLAWSWWKRCGGSVGFALSRNAFLAFLSCTIFIYHPLGRGPIRVWRCLGVDVTHIESRFEFGETLHSKRHRKAFAPPGSNRKCTFSPENDKSFCHACQSQLHVMKYSFPGHASLQMAGDAAKTMSELVGQQQSSASSQRVSSTKMTWTVV